MSKIHQYDLMPYMASYLDIHMLFPLLDFAREIEMYETNILIIEKMKVIRQTNMLELLEDEYNKYHNILLTNDINEYQLLLPQLEKRKEEIFYELDNPCMEVKRVIEFFANQQLIDQLESQQQLTIEYISLHYDITIDSLDQYYKYSKFKYDCGMYNEIEKMLSNYLKVSQITNNPNTLGALWGRLACLILTAKWDDALIAFKAVKEAIDSRTITSIDQLRLRTWLLHWALFIFINQDSGIELLIDLFMEKSYLQTIENLCPWLLRYYAAAIILSPIRRRSHLREVLLQISLTSYLYSDSITLFLVSLFENFDFDEAQNKLIECQELIKYDFFLQIFMKRFIKESRVLICEMYCTINRRIDLHMLAEKLQFTEEEAERWMVDMIRGNNVSEGGSTLDAKIDSAAKQVVMPTPAKYAYANIAEKTRELTSRSEALSMNFQKILPDQVLFNKHRYQNSH